MMCNLRQMKTRPSAKGRWTGFEQVKPPHRWTGYYSEDTSHTIEADRWKNLGKGGWDAKENEAPEFYRRRDDPVGSDDHR